MTATLSAGTLENGAGNLSYIISGTPASTGTASFAISFRGQSCVLALTVNATSIADCSSQTGAARVVCLANSFLTTLTTSQQASVVLPLTLDNAKRWSNLRAVYPAGTAWHSAVFLQPS